MTPTVASKDDFHRERSRFLDAFAILEELLLRLPKEAADKRTQDELKDLRAIRNDLVHAPFRFIQVDGELHALCINAMQARREARQARIVKLGDFQLLKARIESTRQELDKAI